MGGLKQLFWIAAVGLIIPCAMVAQTNTTSRVVYQTHFEKSEGYDLALTLSGQQNWVSDGPGGSGLVTNFFAGMGQQAYIGFTLRTNSTASISVWRPLDIGPVNTNMPLVRFKVTMEIVDSQNNRFDDFRWSIYNTNGNRLFSLDFDNNDFSINYSLDNGTILPTGLHFAHGGNYDLEVVMNLARNVWSATLNDAVIVNSKAMTTQGFPLNFGDADAVWVIRTPGSPGDNFMLFDDYTVSVESVPAIRPRLQVLASNPRQAFALRILGEAGRAYVIDASPDMKLWTAIKTNTSLDGTFDLVDLGSPGAARRFYRARLY